MVKTLVHVTTPIVIQEIENVLATYPEFPYQDVFSQSNIRQDLIAYVLNRIPNHYEAIDKIEPSSKSRALRQLSSEQKLYLENWIHTGIYNILHWDNFPMPQTFTSRSISSDSLA
ncbi:late competence development ComFB family protein [Moorena producens JHB]|uniref:Late competence development ComFB family protein n=1 Tax=Moorena producens (strain JHB) TaxID=1454205 RepID=A0A1D9FT34_MOOP1|nr:late competence development ComFB family protein [Moorena producens]AOY78512.1 late competence development ComFB family protein [Moorena producens JHB]